MVKGDIGVVGGAGTKGEVGSVSKVVLHKTQVQSIPNTNQNAKILLCTKVSNNNCTINVSYKNLQTYDPKNVITI